MASHKPRNKPDIRRISFLRAHMLQAKKSFFALWFRPLGNSLTLAVIAMALTMPASLYLVGKNIVQVAEGIASPSQLSVYLHDDTPEARIMVLKDELESWPEIKAINYVSPQQGLSDLSQYAGFDDAIALLSDYSLPAVLIISPGVEQDSAIRQIASRIGQMDEISDVRMDEDWMARLDSIRTLAITVAVILVVLMLSAVFLIVGNTLRFTVLAHKDEIQVMKMIGATDSFILRPYLYSGVWFGVLGAILAWILTAIITILLNGAVEDLAQLYDSHFRLIGLNVDESFALLMLGAFLGFVAARLSTRRHLKEIEPV
ncbi:cell division protein FtsX [Vibrio albus]|uniref:Cell division protein FtsX n=1 Tax=Vibrio albus TaxID=2200953 RepID=A0A2U3B4Z5_9VIBR|nr:permease-like cell division protein FtsX [Vibrio albus]PWI31870.1 cell division protein FtsX [Vibrio albus]